MFKAALFTVLSATSVLVLAGCESHQAKVDRLQKEYDRLAAQFHQDCSAEYLKVPPTPSAKCTDEDNRVKAAWDQLQAERSKQ
jgi:outer membrane murein-binding lipoprotein Lpp